MNEPSRLAPIVIGAALVTTGVVVRQWQPRALSLPTRPEVTHTDSGLPKAARKTRDAVARIVPSNVTSSVGRTLMIAGIGLLILRLLDVAVEDGEEIF